jgi:low density lipoprotein-related protein 2
VNQTQLCDNIRQCPDGSDEGGFCSRDDCSIQNGGCSHTCEPSPIGSMCLCPYGYETRNDSNYKKCEDIDECRDESACNQLCANTPGRYNCACAPGYFRVGRKLCKSTTRNYAKVYVTNGRSLLITDLEGTSVNTMRKTSTMKYITAFDFHNQTERIFWADWTTKAIYSCYENGSDVKKIISSGVSIVEAIAVDWIGKNIYWADYVMQHIEVSRLDGKRRRILFNVSFYASFSLLLKSFAIVFSKNCYH